MRITAFLAYNGLPHTKELANRLFNSGLVKDIYLVTTQNDLEGIANCQVLVCESIQDSKTINKIASLSNTEYSLILTKDTEIDFAQFAIERFIGIADDTNAGLVYSDYFEIKDEVRSIHPVIDYQKGSLRDDFEFGYVLFYRSSILKEAYTNNVPEYKFAGLYDLRLKVSQKSDLFRVNEYLYTVIENDNRKSGEKLFDYVNPRNRQVQVEMEIACTEHLKALGGYLKPEFKDINFSDAKYEFEASVIIPVKNRAKTISDAIASVLMQKTDFKFNLIIVDNYSDDGTTEIIKGFAEKDNRVVHIIPTRKDLGIGGCWNEAVHSSYCGKFSIQLDSDDVYKDETTIDQVVKAFYDQKCGMVVGTYQMTNFKLEEIPPGIIDHKEWTPENGRNNALRINGLGAPRAFYTPLLREIKIPNVSYGEDYAVGLSISREYQIGRIYNPIYICRRWDGNSDSALDIVKQNNNNLYKDRIRTIELTARILRNSK